VSQVANYNVENQSGANVRADLNSIFSAIRSNNSGGEPSTANSVAFLIYADTGSNKLRIRNSSNNAYVDIGNINEANLGLLPKAGGTMTGALLADDSSGAGSPALSFDGDSDTGLFRKAANTIAFSTAGVERLFLDNNGLTVQAQGELRLADQDSSNYLALKAPTTIGTNVTLTLPADDGNSGDMLQTNGSGVLTWQAVQGVPTGAVFCVAWTTVPSGYAECKGQSEATTGTYAALFAVIGYNYGGSGSSFNLPDLRGEFIRGWDHGKGTDNSRPMGSAGWQGFQNGQHTHTATATSTSSPHSHSLNYERKLVEDTGWARITDIRREGGDGDGGADTFSNDTTSGFMNDTTVSVSTSVTVNNSGGTSNSAESRPRNLAMMYVIKL
jgi:microcystin-dependent protein